MNTRVLSLAIALLLTTGLVACKEEIDKERQRRDVEVELGELRSAMASSLDDAEKNIDELGQRLEVAGENASEEYQKLIASIRQERADIAKEMESMKTESVEALDESGDALRDRMATLDARILEARLWTLDQKDEFESAVESEMKDLSQEIDELQEQAQYATVDLREHYDETIADLRKQQEELDTRWQELRIATDEQFKEMRKDFAKAISTLDRELNTAVRKLDRAASV